jgi:predicted PurR-regulated permease PerM
MATQPAPIPQRQAPLSPSPIRAGFFLLAFITSIVFCALVLEPFLSSLVLSLLLVSLFRPVHLFFNQKLPEKVAAALTTLLIVAIVFIPLTFFTFALADEALNLYGWGKDSQIALKIQEFFQENRYILQFREQLRQVGIEFDPTELSSNFFTLARQGGMLLYNQVSAWIANILSFFFLFLLMIVVIFFLLMDLPRMLDQLVRLSPLPEDEDRLLIDKFQEIANAIIKVNGICGAIQGVVGGAIFYFLDLSSPVFWGCIMAVVAFMPILGIGLVMIPTALVLALGDRVEEGIFVFVCYLVLSLGVEYLLKPKMVGTRMQMPTLWIFLFIIGGMAVYGVLGIIYGPLILTAFLTLSEIYLKKYDDYVRCG